MPQKEIPITRGDESHPLLPASRLPGWLVNVDIELTKNGVNHQVGQLGLPGNMGVERHGAGMQAAGDVAHRDGSEPLGVGDVDGGGDDGLDGEARAPRPVARSPEKGQAARGVGSRISLVRSTHPSLQRKQIDRMAILSYTVRYTIRKRLEALARMPVALSVKGYP